MDQYRYPLAAAARPVAGDALAGASPPVAVHSAAETIAAQRPARSRRLVRECGSGRYAHPPRTVTK